MLPRKELTVRRAPADGHYDADGLWKPASLPQEFVLRASVQPAQPHDLQMLPEGRRQNRAYRLFCNQRLRGLSDTPGPQAAQPDRVLIDDDWYEVLAPEEWRNGVVSHHTALVSRLEEQPV